MKLYINDKELILNYVYEDFIIWIDKYSDYNTMEIDDRFLNVEL